MHQTLAIRSKKLNGVTLGADISKNIVCRQFETDEEVAAYKDGVDALRGDVTHEIFAQDVLIAHVVFNDDAPEAIAHDTEAEKDAFIMGLDDANDFERVDVLTEEDPGFSDLINKHSMQSIASAT